MAADNPTVGYEPLALVFDDPADYERLKADDRVSLVDLSHLQPRRPVECVIQHVDGTLDRSWLKHSHIRSTGMVSPQLRPQRARFRNGGRPSLVRLDIDRG
jgi:hypothetical protein